MILWTDNPERDAARYYEENKPKKIGVCEQCSDPIYEGDDHYDIDGDMVHWDCLTDYMDKYRVRGL